MTTATCGNGPGPERAMKDAFAAGSSTRLARLSVHDVVGDLSLEAVLRDPIKVDLDALRTLLEARTA